MSLNHLQSLISRGQLNTITNEHVDCLACRLAKQTALPFNNSESVSHGPFDLIHFDIWGPSSNATIGGSRYFVIFVDDYSHFTWLYRMKNRSEFTKIYCDFA